MFGSDNKRAEKQFCLRCRLSPLAFSFSQLVFPSQMRLEMPLDYKDKSHTFFKADIQ